MRTFILIFLLIFLTSAQAADVSLSTQIDRQKATIGDPIHFTLTVSADKQTNLTLPKPGESLGQFDILDYSVSDPVNKDGKFSQQFTYTISNYAVGTYAIPPITVLYEENGQEQRLISDTVEIEIQSVTTEEAQDIKDIKTIAELIKKYLPYFLILAGIIISILLGWFIYKKLQKPAAIIAEPEIILPPYEEAIQKFNHLMNQKLIESGAVKEFYLELSEIIKRYLGRIYDIQTMERTSSEIIFDLKDCPVKEPALIEELLTSSDLVKFAKFIPAEQTNTALTQTARTIIENERPAAHEPAEGGTL